MSRSGRVLVTGGAGFIGSSLVRSLVRDGFVVSVLDDLSTGVESNLKNLEVKLYKGDISNFDIVLESAKDVDLIVHLAARGSVPRSIKNPRATFNSNVVGTFNICEAARLNNLPLVFSSSSSVYGANTRPNKTEDEWLSPLSPYAATKLSDEALITSYARAFKLQTAIFRLFNVFGPGQRPEHQYSAVIPKWIWAALNEQGLILNGDGLTTRDFTYIDNVVDIFKLAITQKRYFDGVVNLAFGTPVTLLQVLDEIKKEFPNILVSKVEERPGDIKSSSNGSKRLAQLFPEIKQTQLSDGIKKTVEWLRKESSEFIERPLVIEDN